MASNAGRVGKCRTRKEGGGRGREGRGRRRREGNLKGDPHLHLAQAPPRP